MKLYNLYNELILEEIKLLFEGVSIDDIDKILDGNNGKFFKVKIKYQSPNGEVSDRFIEIYQRDISTASNGLIDAYQLSKNNQVEEGWRKFRLDRIMSFEVTKVPFYQPKNGFNKTGNNSPTVASVNKIANVGSYQYAQSTINQKARQEKQNSVTDNNLNNKI